MARATAIPTCLIKVLDKQYAYVGYTIRDRPTTAAGWQAYTDHMSPIHNIGESGVRLTFRSTEPSR
jgi:hypothetical protein